MPGKNRKPVACKASEHWPQLGRALSTALITSSSSQLSMVVPVSTPGLVSVVSLPGWEVSRTLTD